jgi:hypothetical protein
LVQNRFAKNKGLDWGCHGYKYEIQMKL